MHNTKVRLKPVTADNWKACAALELLSGQEKFLPSNLYSIAKSQFYEYSKSKAIYNERNQLIGYALFGRDILTNKWKIFRIMIDRSYQGRGYGKCAMKEIIEQISKEPGGNEILICYQIDNQAARRLYPSLGFVEQKVDLEGKVTALLKLTKT